MKNMLQVDFLKIKRKGFYLLALLGPLGVVALQMVNYGVRKEYLLQQSDVYWNYYLMNVNAFTPLAVVLGIAILTSFITNIENEKSAWKMLLALPVSKMAVYLSKFTVLFIIFLISSCLLAIFTLAFGMYLDLGRDLPYQDVLSYSFYPFFAAIPILALQLWIATVSQNQAIPITTGIIGTILTYSAYNLPDWLIWKWPSLMNEWNEPIYNVLLGLGVGLIIYMLGMTDFVRRDVT